MHGGRRARQSRGPERPGAVVHGFLLSRGGNGDAVRGKGLCGALLPHGAGERDRQSDPARDQALRQSAHGAPHARAYRRGRLRNHAQGDQHGPGGRHAPREGVPHRERPAHRRRSAWTSRARPHPPVPEPVMNRLILPLLLSTPVSLPGEGAGVQVAERAALKERIEALVATMKEIGSAKEKTVITLDFLPESGTRVTVDGEPRGKTVPGEDFFVALLRIWLGEKPVDADLKKAMLGGGR